MTVASPSYSQAASPDPLKQDLSWLSQLPTQPIFSCAHDKDKHRRKCTQTDMVVRGSDIIVLVDGQLRMMSLSSLKNRSSRPSSSSQPKAYKILSNPVLDEVLRSSPSARVEITLNPAETLLAISLPSTLVIVILPRSNSLLLAAAEIPVKAHRVGTFYHNPHSPRSEQIACARWHPWSKRGTSLLALLRNGTFYEYDVARDLTEPLQRLQLLPADHRASSPRIGFGRRGRGISLHDDDGDEEVDNEDSDDDDDETIQATSFTLGIGHTSSSRGAEASTSIDWTPLTIYVLTRSGDLYAAAPFLPKHAQVPSSYLHGLSSLAQRASEVNANRNDPLFPANQRDYALRFVSNLLKQAKAYQESQAENAFPEPGADRRRRAATPAELLDRPERPRGMGKSSSTMSISLDPVGPEDAEADAGSDEPEDQLIELKAPSVPIVLGPIVAQGPFLLAPAPHELSEERESQGTEIAYVRLPSSADSVNLEALLLLGDDGRVDVGVLTVAGKISPKWATKETAGASFAEQAGQSLRNGRPKAIKAGRYGLDSSDEDEGDDDELKMGDLSASTSAAAAASGLLPTLFIYETLDLGFPDHRPSLRPPPRFVRDPVYPDTLYAHHAHGAHMICLASWAQRFAALLKQGEQEEMGEFMRSGKQSEVKWMVKIQDSPTHGPDDAGRDGVSKVAIIDDIYLGYSLLVLLGDGECFGLEMSLRTDSSSLVASLDDAMTRLAMPAETDAHGKSYYTSLLGSEPYVPPAPFNGSATSFPAIRLKTTNPAVSKGELQVTPETLRLLGTTVQDLRAKMRDVVQGGNAIPMRLELQIKELQRQLGKLNDVRLRLQHHEGKASEGKAQQQKRQGGGGGGGGAENLSERIARVGRRQRTLLERVDRVLQRSMDAGDVGMSKYEEAWLKEMGSLEREMGRPSAGAGAGAGVGLSAKVEMLEAQLEEMKPELDVLRSDSDEAKRRASQLGQRQLERILRTLADETERVTEAKDKAQSLARSMAKIQGHRLG